MMRFRSACKKLSLRRQRCGVRRKDKAGYPASRKIDDIRQKCRHFCHLIRQYDAILNHYTSCNSFRGDTNVHTVRRWHPLHQAGEEVRNTASPRQRILAGHRYPGQDDSLLLARLIASDFAFFASGASGSLTSPPRVRAANQQVRYLLSITGSYRSRADDPPSRA